MNRHDKMYRDLYQLVAKVYTSLTGPKCQALVNEKWKAIKKGKEVDEDKFKQEIANLQDKIGKSSIRNFFNKPRPTAEPPVKELLGSATPGTSHVPRSAAAQPAGDEDVTEVEDGEAGPSEETEMIDDESETEAEFCTRSYDTPAQNKLKEELASAEQALARLIEARNLDLGGCSVVSLTRRIKEVTKAKDDLKVKLKKSEQNMINQKKLRDRKKEEINKIKRDYPEIASTLRVREEPGRPRLEEDQPNINRDILGIAMIGAACSDRRREDLMRTIKTLDQLHAALKDLGYKISRSGVYLRLLPRDATNNEGKKHVQTVPVRLVRPENNLRKSHPDRMFAAESFKTGQNIVEFLGPDAAVYISQDDKSSVHIGVTAAKKQGCMLMNMRVRVRLPDHDFNVGSKHLLIPSVLAHCKIDPLTGKVSYSGETYIGIRSSKHNNSSAYSHNDDLQTFIKHNPGVFLSPGSAVEVKPVIVKGTDGGPDENPRFEKNIIMGCKTFQV